MKFSLDHEVVQPGRWIGAYLMWAFTSAQPREFPNLRWQMLAAILPCSIAICAAHAQEAAMTPQGTAKISVVSDVPPDDLTGKTLSISRFSCEFFVVRFSDKGLQRGRVDQIRAQMEAAFRDRQVSKPIHIKEYTLHLNNGIQAQDLSQQAGAAVTGGSYVTNRRRIFPVCAKERMRYGWFDPSEVSNSNPPLIGEVKVEYDSKIYYSRFVFSSEKSLFASGVKYQVPAKQAVIDALNNDIIRQISQDLPKS